MAICGKCGRETGTPVAAISGSIMGNEHTDAYHFCEACDMYTVILWVDHFLGEETESEGALLSRQEGDARTGLIRRCRTPWDKGCRCEAHREYFQGYALD